MRTPKLETIQMIKEEIDSNSSIYQLWKKLPKKTMYQTYKKAIEYLKDTNQIIIKENKISLININQPSLSNSRNDILFSLSYYGYDLISAKTIKGKLIQKERLIIEILLKYPEARLIEAIPFLIKDSNKFELYRLAKDYNLINQIGFLTDITIILYKTDMKDLKKELYKEINNTKYLTNIKDKDYLEKNTSNLMKKWNLRGLFKLEDFKKISN
ncbi:hypothetical protein J4438_03180 [Candidatus Woesearchaeota archaeon]|nr:hypothetical protein [Candidatus Woesearchaeota archaeon]